MNGFPLTCLVDTNIPKTANLAVDPGGIPDDLVECVFACVEAIDHVRKFGNLILDAEGEIFAEYQKNLSMRGQPGVGDAFLKWVHDHQWSWPDGSRVKITKNGDSYDEFPPHESGGLDTFDISDRKFIAVANAHPEKPPVMQGTDSKWVGWEAPLADVGITVFFVCRTYATKKYQEKFGT